jgi:hypothetical protein
MKPLTLGEDILQIIKAKISNLRADNTKMRIEIDKNMEFINELENWQFSIEERLKEENK